MKKYIIVIISALALAIQSHAANTFAIFADEQTYLHCQSALGQYRDVLISEGLDARIYHADWQSPDEVKDIILALASKKRNPLEGAVFVGDVPIVMVRGGQHLTTAFKMDEERYPMQESSVASDRFYDDFDLDFEFIARDTVDTARYFYKLTSKGSQTLRPEIYTGRIRVPAFMTANGADRYALISKYLLKAVAAHRESNVLDNMQFFYGSGYNSEDMNVLREKVFASEEEFPYTVGRASSRRFLNFHQEEQMKWTLFSELQRPETDFFQFSEHGGPEVQYISGFPERQSLVRQIEDLHYAVATGKKGRAALDSIALHIDPAFLSDSAVSVLRAADSLRNRHKDIYQEEIAAISSNPRVIVLNACYNNSFHDPEGYIAGAHIFSDGRCIAVQGNTVNVLQDKFENKLVGLLSLGIRVGLWQKEFSYLESHLAGDPTFRFSPAPQDEALSEQLYRDLVHKPLDIKTWKRYLKSESPILRSAALVHLAYAGVTDKALSMLRNDPSSMVRMHALNILLDTPQIEEALIAGLNDPYELILRHSVRAACDYAAPGADSCVYKAVQHLASYHTELVRVQFYAQSYRRITNPESDLAEEAATAANLSLKPRKRISSIRTFRNNNYIPAIDALVEVLADNNDDPSVRLVCAEALGWYDRSYARQRIINDLSALDTRLYPEELVAEIEKTIKRLEHK